MTLPPLVKETRALEECELTHGGRVLTLAVMHGKKRVTTVYLVERGEGCVNLVKDDGEVYEVWPYRCSCSDAKYRHKTVVCKHRAACQQLSLFPAPIIKR